MDDDPDLPRRHARVRPADRRTRPHEASIRESTTWVCVYVGLPRQQQQKVLLLGILLALVLRGAFIAIGAAAISRFSWVFYIFGLFLVYTAVKLAAQGETDEGDYKENALVRMARRALTPTVVVLIAIGTTDLIFALDSIPAIFGLTRSTSPARARSSCRPTGRHSERQVPEPS